MMHRLFRLINGFGVHAIFGQSRFGIFFGVVTKQKTKQNSWDALQKLYNDVFFGVTWFYMVIHHIKPCKTMYNGV